MRTILEWLNEAKQQGYEWADAAIRNYNPDFFRKENVLSLSDALLHAFNWEATPEKDTYWDHVFDSIETTPYPNPTILELAKMYEYSKVTMDGLKPDYDVEEPYRTQILETYNEFYGKRLEDIRKQILEKIGFGDIKFEVSRLTKALKSVDELDEINSVYSDKINRLEKEFNDYKVKSEDKLRSYQNECDNYITKIDQLQQQLIIKSCDNERMAVGWITEDYYCCLLRHKTKPRKVGLVWVSDNDTCTITYEDAFALCGRIPAWPDKEPIPIYE